ncbi:MAG: hypothetical protein GWN58_20595 [Anaerolineae bacterium]|nr:hypothetical protein [Anaerolineae bacterium]
MSVGLSTGGVESASRFSWPWRHAPIAAGFPLPCGFAPAGLNTAPDLPGYDFEGDSRTIDGDGNGDPVVDEVPIRVYLPLVVRNC